MSWASKNSKRQKSHHHNHRQGGATAKNQGSNDINRLIEEGLRQQRERAQLELSALETKASSSAKQKDDILPSPDNVKTDHKTNDASMKHLGSMANVLLQRQMGVQLPGWYLMRNNLSVLGNNRSRSVPVEESPLDIVSHSTHGVAYLCRNSIQFLSNQNKPVQVFQQGHELLHLAWSADTNISIMATISSHQSKGYIGITRMDHNGENIHNDLLPSSALYNNKYIDQIHSLHWGFHSHHLMSVDPKVISVYDLEHGGALSSKHHLTSPTTISNKSSINNNKQEEIHSTTIAKNTLLSSETHSPTLLVGNRNGSLWHLDMRSSSSNQMMKIQQMTYCIDHIACMQNTSYYYLVQDICGNLMQYDIRKPSSSSSSVSNRQSQHSSSNSSSSNRNRNSHSNTRDTNSSTIRTSNNAPQCGNGWLLSEGSRIAKSRFWISPDNAIVATTTITPPHARNTMNNTVTTTTHTSNTVSSILVHHTHTGSPTLTSPLLKTHPIHSLLREETNKRQAEQKQQEWQCVKVLFGREMGPQPSETIRMIVAMQESPQNRPSYLQQGANLITKYHLVSI